MDVIHDPLLYRGKYRVPSARLQGRDYRYGKYFVTICTQWKRPWFSEIENGIITLLPPGVIVAQELAFTSIIRPYVTLDACAIMPDHVHAMFDIHPYGDDVRGAATPVETSRRDVSTVTAATPVPSRLRPRSLGAIVNQIKSICTKRIRALGYDDFAWQPRFHDRLIRDGDALETVRAYIRNNPREWGKHGGGFVLF